MRGRDFLDAARAIAEVMPVSAGYRSAISRAYYAAYLEVRSFLEDHQDFQRSRSAREHGEVARLMQIHLSDMAGRMEFMRAFRNQADYDLQLAETTVELRWPDVLIMAESVIAELDLKRDEIAVRGEPG